MLPPINSHGLLETANQVRPLVTLTVYNHAVIMRKDTPDGVEEYPVDPAEISKALAAKHSFSSGFVDRDTLFVGQSGSIRTVIGYRRAQMTGLWLEGSDEPVRVPMPALIMVRSATGLTRASYEVYAVRGRPKSDKCALFRAPLPHVNDGVCWGTVALPSASSLQGTSLTEDWRNFLGSRFGNHSVNEKSKRQPKDIRKLYFELEGESSYPLDDLIPSRPHSGMRLKDLFARHSAG